VRFVVLIHPAAEGNASMPTKPGQTGPSPLTEEQTEAVAGGKAAAGNFTITTQAIGEEGPPMTTLAIGEEDPVFTTLAVGEEDPCS
jgi:hypothetical protein